MSKTFKEDYYGDDGWGRKKQGKSSKQKRLKVKDYLRHLEQNGIIEDEDFDFEEKIEE